MASKKAAVRKGILDYLNIQYEGYFMCRIATDPDPTNETKGRSGYTFALPGEKPLDQAIRLQFANWAEDPTKGRPGDLREPATKMNGKSYPTVSVSATDLNGNNLSIEALSAAKVNLLGKDKPLDGPIFESRNNIVGSDNTMAFVVNPFHMVIGDDKQPALDIHAAVNPRDKREKIWQVADPAVYKDRLPVAASFDGDDQLNQATGVFDYDEYFRARSEWLQVQIDTSALEEALIRLLDKGKFKKAFKWLTTELNVPGYVPANPDLVTAFATDDATAWADQMASYLEDHPGILAQAAKKVQLASQKYQTRLYNINFWGSRVVTKMGYKVSWDHMVTGNARKSQLQCFDWKGVTYRLDFSQPWRAKYWFGGWDGDLLLGYHQGSLSIPIFPVD